MAWCWPGDKSLPEPIMVSLLTHICFTRPQWVKYRIEPNRFLWCNWCNLEGTVYPKKYAHGFCFAVLCCGYTLNDFPISIRLTSLALWQSNDCPSASKATLMNMDKYFIWIHYERLHNHNKTKHNKTVCIFSGTYCTCQVWNEYIPACNCVCIISHWVPRCLNSLRPRLNRCPFADDIFTCIFLDENKLILIRISLKFVPKVRINDIPALVQIMAWRQSGDKSLSEPMMVRLPTHISVTRPQWVKYFMKHTTKTHNTPKGMALLNRILYLFYFIEHLKAIESWDKTPTVLTLRNV